MTQKDKNLVKQYVCMSIPFGLKAQIKLDNEIFIGTIYGVDENSVIHVREGNDYKEDTEFEDIKPYLRPMSSMTDEEKEELVDFGLAYWDNGKHTDENGNTIIYGGKEIQLIPDIETYDWLNRYHFDYRGLIPKDLAIEVTEENNPYK